MQSDVTEMKDLMQLSLRRLAEALEAQQGLALRLGISGLTIDQMDFLLGVRRELLEKAGGVPEADVLELCDREESLAAWMDARQVPDPWGLTAALAEAGCGPALLARLEQELGSKTLPGALAWLERNLTTTELLQTLEQAADRMIQSFHR